MKKPRREKGIKDEHVISWREGVGTGGSLSFSLQPDARWEQVPGKSGFLVEPLSSRFSLPSVGFGFARYPDPLQPGASRPDCGGRTAGRAPLRAAQLLGDCAMDQRWAGTGHGSGTQR